MSSAVVLLFISLVGCGTSPTRTIEFGVDLPLSGVDGASAIPARNAVILAIEQANKRGLPGGYHLALEDLDDTVGGKHDPAQGASNLKTLVADPGVLAVIGPINSNVAKAEIPISNAAGLALLTMGASAIELTRGPAAAALRTGQPGRVTFFRLCAADDEQGGVSAQYARTLGLRRVFIIDDNESYGRGIADVFSNAFTQAGGQVLGREHLTSFALDYKALLTKVKERDPDVIFFGGIVSTGGAVLRKQMADVGLAQVPYFGGDGLSNPQYVPLAGSAADGTYFTAVAPDVDHFVPGRAFFSAYRARFGADAGNYGPASFAAAQVAVAAITAALAEHPDQIPTRDEVLTRIAATSKLATPVGPVTFDSSGDLRHATISLYRIRAGRFEFVKQSSAP